MGGGGGGGGGVGGGRFCHPRSISSKKIITVRVRRWNTLLKFDILKVR